MKKPETFTYVDSQIIDGKELHCKFDVDYGYRETRWEPGDLMIWRRCDKHCFEH